MTKTGYIGYLEIGSEIKCQSKDQDVKVSGARCGEKGVWRMNEFNKACPNCGFDGSLNILTMLDLDKDKAFSCPECGTQFNIEDIKQTALVPDDVDTPEKLAKKKIEMHDSGKRLAELVKKSKLY